jgi:hypothetical protein
VSAASLAADWRRLKAAHESQSITAPMSAITAIPRKGAIAEARTVSKSVQEDVREGLLHIEGSLDRLTKKMGS